MRLTTIDDLDFKNKIVLVRVDINTSCNESTHEIEDSGRLREHAKTLKELSEKQAKVVVLAHQGRKENPDCVYLDQHAGILSKHIGRQVDFVDDIIGEKALNRIKTMKASDIILLDNVRFLDEETEEKTAEEHSRGKLVSTLAPLIDIFVNDAFSTAHRSHASLVGFNAVLPSVAGRVMVKEWSSIQRIMQSDVGARTPVVFVFGGNKPDDCLRILEHVFEMKPEKIKTVLTAGVLGELFLMAKGYDLGITNLEYLEKKRHLELLDRVRNISDKFIESVEMPYDVAFNAGGRKEISIDSLPADDLILDIGRQTMEKYAEILKKAESVVIKGTAGVYEKRGFEIGTKNILETVASLNAFTLVGGGDTSIAMEKLGIDKNRISYVSIAGGAFITAISGEKLPAIEALLKPE